MKIIFTLLLSLFTCFGAGYYFTGSIDDCRIFNRALSKSEVAYIYAAGME